MTAEIAEVLEWDSAFFGVRIGRLTRRALREADAHALLAWARAQGVACIYCLLDASDQAGARAAEATGARRVDVRTTYQLDLASRAPRADISGEGIRLAGRADLDQLERIAATAHRDTRFHADPRFPRERVTELYRTWIRRSVEGEIADAVVTCDVDGRAAGYVSLSLPVRTGEPGTGALGLVAVDERARGRGLGRGLVESALARLRAGGARRVRVVTQGANVGAQRLYEAAGFAAQRREVWFHLWPEVAGAPPA